MLSSVEAVSVWCECDGLASWAQTVADSLQITLNGQQHTPYTLVFHNNGVFLQANEQGKHGRVMVDFCSGSMAHRRRYGGGKGQMIAKAVGVGKHFRPSILDATAGLGKDAFVLASMGCTVTMMERSPVAFALLADGLRRAQDFAEAHDPDLLEIVQRMSLRAGDSIHYLQTQLAPAADVVYLDPMFPERLKQAAVKKEMQAFHTIIGQDLDAETLLSAALHKAEYRVVVKRPRIAPSIDGASPNYALQGKSSRYDIYTFKGVPKGLECSAGA